MMESDSVVSFTDLFILFETVKSKTNDDNLASLLKKCYYDKIVHQVIIEQIDQLNIQAVRIIFKIIQVLWKPYSKHCLVVVPRSWCREKKYFK